MSASSAMLRADEQNTTNVMRQVRLTFAQVMSLLIIVLPLFGIVAQYGANYENFTAERLIANLLASFTGVVCFFLVRRRQISAAGMIASGIMVLIAVFVDQNDIRTLVSLMSVIIAATLTGRYFFLSVFAFLMAVPIFRAVSIVRESGLERNFEVAALVISAGILFSVTAIFRYFYSVMERTSQNAEDSYQRLTSIAVVGRQTSRILNYDELLSQSVELIKQQFGFYHVQIFLVDERREYAVLVASTGEAGRRLLGRNHKLGIGSQSVIGRSTLANEPVLINDTENEPGHAFNPLLPETRAELALPMQVQTESGVRVTGALDVQSETPMAFSATDVQALQALANQLAVAIRNAQLFETQETSLHENETLFRQAQASLEEIKRLNSQLTRQAWEGFVENHAELTGVQIQGESVTYNAGWTPLMIEACYARDTISHKDDGVRVTATPLMLRDEILGAVEVVGGDEEEINLVEAIVAFTERFAVALENVRLVEEAQAASLQEQRISAVVSRFQEAETVDELLQITLTELSDTLDADGGSIRVGLSAGGQAAR